MVAWTRADADGKFSFAHVPDGSYTVTWWDEPQDYILDLQNVTVGDGEDDDMGILPLTGWWTIYEGYVFNDDNRNGVMDWTDTNHNGCPDPGEGEQGVPNYTLTMRRRENTLMDRGTTTVSTDNCGKYTMEAAYPMTQWLVIEAYNDLYYTTGVTYQADNQPEPTTVLGAGVDVSTLPIIGLGGTLDWGVHSYDASGKNGIDPRNGGIVGTVSYDTTRNELDPRYAAVEDWQPGVSGLTVDLYAPVNCGTHPGTPCDSATHRYELATDGSYAQGQLLNTYVTETWHQPGTGTNDAGQSDGECIPRDVDGNILDYPAAQQITKNWTDCLEGPPMGIQFQRGFSTVDGNYGFADGCYAPNHTEHDDVADPTNADPAALVCKDAGGADVGFTALKGGMDYLVHVEDKKDALGVKNLYQFTREEDINIANGDSFTPQQPPAACVGALHTVDVEGSGTDNFGSQVVNGITVPASTPVHNPTFADPGMGGSPYEGQAKPICDTKLVPLANGRSIVPTFNVFTDVAIPGRFWGLVVDDLNFSSDPHQINFGEKAGVPFAPVGIYDYTNRLEYTTESDYSGLFDVLMPSTNRISCPTPSGVCANVFRFVGNDPGVPGHLNTNYLPNYRTIAAEFESVPGQLIPADLAPTQVGVVVQLPGGQANTVQCAVSPSTPEIFSVDKPYVKGSGNVVIQGQHFGADSGAVTLGGTAGGVTINNWTDTEIDVTIAAGADRAPGAYQMMVTTTAGATTVNGLTFHVISPPVPVVPVFSPTAYLDTFTSNNTSNSLSGSWTTTNNAWGRTGTTAISRLNSGESFARWNGNNSNFAANQQAWVQLANLGTAGSQQGLLLKSSSSTYNGILVAVTNGGTSVSVRTKTSTSNNTAFTTQDTFAATFHNGDVLGTRTFTDGRVEIYNGSTLLHTTNLAGVSGLANLLANGGRIGMYSNGTSTSANGRAYDNFGGGSFTITLTGGYNPTLFEVGPGKPFAPTPVTDFSNQADHAIQRAIDAAAANKTAHQSTDNLVVVYPNDKDIRLNPRGAYYENLIINKAVKLQGVGPGGTNVDGTVDGSIIDGSAASGDSAVATDWYTHMDTITWDGNQSVNDGAVISIYTSSNDFGSTNNPPSFKPAIDGFDIRGGDQQGFPGNLNAIGGGNTGLPANVVTQGGAIFANAYARNLQITNNMVQNNGGGYGTIRIGTPDLARNENQNQNVMIANNRVIQNAGTNLAGGIGIFNEADNYVVKDNDICGNFSAEYGGAITAMGLSPNGRIEHNRIWFNRSYDEGGGVTIAGELPADTTRPSAGSGAVTITRNLIQANLGNDDGGGLRFLMAGTAAMTVSNNMIVNNVSTHEGGGVALNDTTNVRFYNNTVMKNITTATAVTSNGDAAPAGLSTSRNSNALQATLPSTASISSNPRMFNNIFWDNRAGTRDPFSNSGVTGIGAAGDTTPIVNWDMGDADGAIQLSPTNSVLQTTTGTISSSTNIVGADPQVESPYDTALTFNNWRTNPQFIGAILVGVDLPPELLGDYHLTAGSPAVNAGAASQGSSTNLIAAPNTDIDADQRPQGAGYEIGADELPALVTNGAFRGLSTSLLDKFNRANTTTGSYPVGTAWSRPQTGYRIQGSQLQAVGGTSLQPLTRTSVYGASQEAFVTLTTAYVPGTTQALVLKSSSTGSSMILVKRVSNTQVKVYTNAPGQGMQLRGTVNGSFGANRRLGARATYDGKVYVYSAAVTGPYAQAGSTVSLSGWPVALIRGGGRIGVFVSGASIAHSVKFDNFGGGSMK